MGQTGAGNIPIMGIMSQRFSAIAGVPDLFAHRILKNAVKTCKNIVFWRDHRVGAGYNGVKDSPRFR